jgi:hypothetical protein
MNSKIKYLAFLSIFSFIPIFSFGENFAKISLLNQESKEILLEKEDLTGIKSNPLLKTKERLDKKYRNPLVSNCPNIDFM